MVWVEVQRKSGADGRLLTLEISTDAQAAFTLPVSTLWGQGGQEPASGRPIGFGAERRG
jgi:hypothetical protein